MSSVADHGDSKTAITEDARAIGHDPSEWEKLDAVRWIVKCHRCRQTATVDTAGIVIYDDLQDACGTEGLT